MITGLLTVDPKKRLSINQLSTHRWFEVTINKGTERMDNDTMIELKTPTILQSGADEIVNSTIDVCFRIREETILII